MEEEKILEQEVLDEDLSVDTDKPLDKNIKLMSPGRMVVRRFLRSKLSIAGLIMLIALFAFCWLGPVFYNEWGETDSDRTGAKDYFTYDVIDEAGNEFVQIVVSGNDINKLADPSSTHFLGTDEAGMDIFARLMYGGRRSLMISFLAVFLTSALGIIMGGLAGYYGGIVDNIIMRICDIFMCLPTLPLMLILGTVLEAIGVLRNITFTYLWGFCRCFPGRVWQGLSAVKYFS